MIYNFYFNAFQKISFQISFGAVRRDLRNQGLGKALVEASLCLAKDLNYETACIDCTNQFQSIIARQVGMRLIWEHPFREVVKTNMHCSFPHTHVQVFACRIKNSPFLKEISYESLVKNERFI